MKPLLKFCLIAGLAAVWFVGMFPGTARAGTLADLSAAINSHHASGAISDVDVYNTLIALVGDAQTAASAEEENALRSSLRDVVDAYTGGAISADAAINIKAVAQP